MRDSPTGEEFEIDFPPRFMHQYFNAKSSGCFFCVSNPKFEFISIQNLMNTLFIRHYDLGYEKKYCEILKFL